MERYRTELVIPPIRGWIHLTVDGFLTLDTGLPCYQEDFHPEYHQMEGTYNQGQLIVLISPKPTPRSPSIASLATLNYIPPNPQSTVSSVRSFKIQNSAQNRITPTPPPKAPQQNIPPKPSYPPPSITSTKTQQITVSPCCYVHNIVITLLIPPPCSSVYPLVLSYII